MDLECMQAHPLLDPAPGQQPEGHSSNHIGGVNEVTGNRQSARPLPEAKKCHCLLSELSPHTEQQSSEVDCPTLAIR